MGAGSPDAVYKGPSTVLFADGHTQLCLDEFVLGLCFSTHLRPRPRGIEGSGCLPDTPPLRPPPQIRGGASAASCPPSGAREGGAAGPQGRGQQRLGGPSAVTAVTGDRRDGSLPPPAPAALALPQLLRAPGVRKGPETVPKGEPRPEAARTTKATAPPRPAARDTCGAPCAPARAATATVGGRLPRASLPSVGGPG